MGTYGLYDTNTVRLTGTGLNFTGVSQVSGTHSIYLSTTATGLVNITNISVNDTNPSVYSSSIFDASPSGNHSLWNIWSTGIQTPTGPTSANGQTTYTYSDAGHSMVFRNGGMIQSFVPPNYYFLPTAGATPTPTSTARCSITSRNVGRVERSRRSRSAGWTNIPRSLRRASPLTTSAAVGFRLFLI